MSFDKPQYTWLWCEDHAKVTDWFMSVTNRRDYDLFYSSFVNIANKFWMKSLDPRAKKLQPLEERIVDCLLEESIPADALIDVLKEYNQLIGGTRGDIKSTGLIIWTSEPPGKPCPDSSSVCPAVLTLPFGSNGCHRSRRAKTLQADCPNLAQVLSR